VNGVAPRSILPTSTLLFLLVNSFTYCTHLETATPAGQEA
jgi:hypothetical protein